jgi:hypothetical protein
MVCLCIETVEPAVRYFDTVMKSSLTITIRTLKVYLSRSVENFVFHILHQCSCTHHLECFQQYLTDSGSSKKRPLIGSASKKLKAGIFRHVAPLMVRRTKPLSVPPSSADGILIFRADVS